MPKDMAKGKAKGRARIRFATANRYGVVVLASFRLSRSDRRGVFNITLGPSF